VSRLVEDIRYEHPRLYFGVVGSALASFLLFVFFSLPTNPFMTSVGINGAQQKAFALGSALFWESQAIMHKKSDETKPSKSIWASLAGLDKDGRLLVSVPDKASWKIEAIRVADTRITDIYGAVGLINQYKSEDALLDYYRDDQVVIWIRNVPFNVKLIEAGFAVPDPNPPTNIVDRAFASYYWYIFKGEKREQSSTIDS
jgi:hypothetical protein